ncbi:hypothetical protein C3L33_07673, partial [Rhododendron williamsianum]
MFGFFLFRPCQFLLTVDESIVFDEADMLLCGSFQNQVIRLINLFRFDEKLLSCATKAVIEKPEDPYSDSLIASEFQDDKDLPTELNLPEQEGAEDDTVLEELTEGIDVKCTKRKDWRRNIWYAHMPDILVKYYENHLIKDTFSKAEYSIFYYYYSYRFCLSVSCFRLEQMWIEVTVDTQVDVLIDSVKQGFRSKEFDSAAGLSRTMVFANTVEAVEAVSKILATSGNECFRYHSYTSLEERTQILVDFQQKGGILVRTDAAARGLDVMNVYMSFRYYFQIHYVQLHAFNIDSFVWIRHVIMTGDTTLAMLGNWLCSKLFKAAVVAAEFARSAVDFLHRVGRTARAGQPGLVTSLYSDSNRDLVDAVRQAGTLDLPVENTFSRKRSFRKKIEKRGRSEVGETLSAGDRVLA